jgi:hypothetical protein
MNLAECFRCDGGACVLAPCCRLNGRLAAAREAFLAELDATLEECVYGGGEHRMATQREPAAMRQRQSG